MNINCLFAGIVVVSGKDLFLVLVKAPDTNIKSLVLLIILRLKKLILMPENVNTHRQQLLLFGKMIIPGKTKNG